MQKSGLCDYNDEYVLFKGTITITGACADVAANKAAERNKKVTFKNCESFTHCIIEYIIPK